jgi:hypothetical protein
MPYLTRPTSIDMIIPELVEAAPLTTYAKGQQIRPLILETLTTTFGRCTAATNSGSEAHNLGEGRVTIAEYNTNNTNFFSIVPNSSPIFETPEWHEPQFADWWPIGFSNAEEWQSIWNSHEVAIDSFLMRGLNLGTGTLTPWFREYDFKGIRWRLAVDHRLPLNELPVLTEGMVLSIQDCNNRYLRYVVDHCAHKDDINAYIKIVCFTQSRRFCDSWSKFPPIILAVPLSHCNVRPHPNTIATTSYEIHEPDPRLHRMLRSIPKKDKFLGIRKEKLQALRQYLPF